MADLRHVGLPISIIQSVRDFLRMRHAAQFAAVNLRVFGALGAIDFLIQCRLTFETMLREHDEALAALVLADEGPETREEYLNMGINSHPVGCSCAWCDD